MTIVMSFMPLRVVRLVLVSLLVSGGVAGAQTRTTPRILVMPFSATISSQAPGGAGAALWIGEAASVLLGESLTSVGLVSLTRDERVAAFERLHLPMSSALTRATMIRVGELLGASEVVFGEVRLGEKLEVGVRTIRVDAAQGLSVITDAADLPDIFTLFARVGDRVAAQLGRAGASRAAVVSVPLESFESYIKGLVATTPAAQQRFLESAARGAPTDARVLMALWRNYSAQGLHDKALVAANAVPLESALVRRARLAVALSLIELKRLDGAYQELSTLYAGSRSAAVSNALGVVQLRRGGHAAVPSAATYFARATKEDVGNTSYLFNLGYAQALAGNAADALVWLREAVRFDAADGDAHLVMSAVLASSGRAAEAQREFDLARLLGATPGMAARTPAHTIPAALERLPVDLDLSATPRLSTAVAIPAQRDQRETAAFHLERARALIEQGKDREATDALRRAVYLSPYEEEPHLLLGQVYQRLGRLTAAIDEFTVALWCRETAAGRLALAAALLEAGEKDSARREVERALVLEPGSASARELLKRTGR
jgi:Tfp pilus assembly protein PilF